MKNALEPAQIARNLRTLREGRGLTREGLAFHTGLSWSAIEQIESGRRRDLRVSTMVALAGALGCKIETLLDPGDQPPRFVHDAFFYESEEGFVGGTEPHVRKGIREGAAALVITTAEKINALQASLGAEATSVDFFEASSWYESPAEALRSLEAYATANAHRGVAAVGEPVWEGRNEGEQSAWGRYESFLNVAFADVRAHVVCPYNIASLSEEVVNCAHQTHPTLVLEAESRKSESYIDPREFMLS